MESDRPNLPAQGSHKPDWLKIKVPLGAKYSEIRRIIHSQRLNTVCEGARCPNINECWNRGTATFMILGNTCTRNCRFCAVKTGKPENVDTDEPRRIAEAACEMDLRHVVITSVTRDDLPDGGAGIFVETIIALRNRLPACAAIEALVPDFQGIHANIQIVIDAKPDILNHNIETVPRLYASVRPQADYQRSLAILGFGKQNELITKTGIMLGLGETDEEIICVLKDLRAINIDIITLGQYLQPSKENLPVARYIHPEEFAYWKVKAYSLGFSHVESGPLVRSSYHAEEQSSKSSAIGLNYICPQ